ncbi:MAG: CPBP family intramembrane metalloprotease [Planctomycetes bacterium]|nr:CPBP family intramembrane metalloprotease [Planctomycetota bacterium]
MSEASVLQHLLDPVAAPPPLAWVWPMIVGGLAVCAGCIWLVRRPLRAMGEPWGALPVGMILPAWLAGGFALLAPMFIGAGTAIAEGQAHGPLLEGAVQIAVTVAAIGGLALFQTFNPPHHRLHWLAVQPSALGRSFVVYAIVAPALLALIAAVVGIALVAGMEVKPQPQVIELTSRRDGLWIAGVYLLACVAAPLREEFVFRVVVYGSIASLAGNGRWSHPARLWAMVISTGLFVAVHGPWWIGVLPLTLLAWVLAALFAHSRSLWPPVVLHALHNTLVVTLQFFVL